MAWELVRSGHLVRSVRLAPFVPGLTAVVVLLVARRGGTDDVIGDLRTLGLLLALGSGYVLDDGAAVTLQASPYGLARRLGLRVGAAVAIVAPLWTLVLVRLLPSAPASDRATLGVGLTVELAAALAVVWAVAAWARRGGFEHPGIITTPVILALLLMAASISRAPMLVGPGPQWTSAHARWSIILYDADGELVSLPVSLFGCPIRTATTCAHSGNPERTKWIKQTGGRRISHRADEPMSGCLGGRVVRLVVA